MWFIGKDNDAVEVADIRELWQPSEGCPHELLSSIIDAKSDRHHLRRYGTSYQFSNLTDGVIFRASSSSRQLIARRPNK
jgi:hypothetical protein